jgi:uncharacterized protein (DUF2235 family)
MVFEHFGMAVVIMLLRNFKKSILAAYQWICENYRPGDKIHLFGEHSAYGSGLMD